jgi:zinc transport system permease protein
VGFNSVFLVCLNRPLALSRGRRVWAVETCFACVVALVVTVSIPWIGLLVINSLLILPAAAARNVARNVPQYLWIAVGVALLSGVGGLIASDYWATATGATVVLLAMGFFVLSLVPRRLGTLRPGRSP